MLQWTLFIFVLFVVGTTQHAVSRPKLSKPEPAKTKHVTDVSSDRSNSHLPESSVGNSHTGNMENGIISNNLVKHNSNQRKMERGNHEVAGTRATARNADANLLEFGNIVNNEIGLNLDTQGKGNTLVIKGIMNTPKLEKTDNETMKLALGVTNKRNNNDSVVLNQEETTMAMEKKTGNNTSAPDTVTATVQSSSSNTTNCSAQCSPFWLKALEQAVGVLQPTHPICSVGNYTSCRTVETVCMTEPTTIVCCPVSCIRPIMPCYQGPPAQNMCIPTNVIYWMSKLASMG